MNWGILAKLSRNAAFWQDSFAEILDSPLAGGRVAKSFQGGALKWLLGPKLIIFIRQGLDSTYCLAALPHASNCPLGLLDLAIARRHL